MKRKLLLLTISLLLLATVFSACSGDKAITGLKITEGLEYTVEIGSTFDTSKVVAEVTYNDNSTVTVTAADLTFSAIDTSTAGKKPLTITYQDFSITVDITVKAAEVKPAELVSIDIVQNFDKELFVGTAFDITKITAIATYDDGTTKTIANADLTVTPVDTTTAGEKTLTVTFEGKSATATITVKPVLLTEITFDVSSFTDWVNPELTAIKMVAHYNNNTTKDIPNAEIEFVTDESGEVPTLTATWGGKSATVALREPVLTGIRLTSYATKGYQGLAYVSSVTALAIYDNNEALAMVIPTAELTISAVDTATAGNKTLTVTWNGQSATAAVQIYGVKAVTIDAATVNNGNKEMSMNAVLDTTTIRVTVTFEDDSQVADLGAANGVTFSTVDTATVGDKTLTATYYGQSATYTITVVSYEIWGMKLPDGIASYVSNQKNFTTQGDVYAVGDDNAFRFALSLVLMDNNTGDFVTKDTPYVSQSKVYRVVGQRETLLTGTALTDMVEIDESAHTFDFKDAAVGQTFRIETTPVGDIIDPEACVAELTVRVVDAYNIYDAKELNLITNYYEADDNLYTHMEIGGTRLYKNQLTIVNEYLAANNIQRPAKELAGVVLHSSLRVTTNDIPAEYLYSYTSSKFGPVKHFLDHFSVYRHGLSAENPTFTMYGNYNSLYTSDLPIIVDAGVKNNDVKDPVSSSELFRFMVQESEVNKTGVNFDHRNYSTRIENLRLRGDDAHDIEMDQAEKHMRSLICIKTRWNIVDIDNVRVEKYLVSLLPEYDNQEVNISNSKFYNGWQNHIYAWNCNLLSRHYNVNVIGTNYAPITINITNSLLAKCGGPVIISDYDTDEGYGYNANSCLTVNADAATQIYTYVTGQESWFNVNGVQPLAMQLLALDIPIANFAEDKKMKAHLVSIGNEDMTGISSANLIFVNRGGKGVFNHEGHGSLNMQDPILNVYEGALWGGAATSQVPPVIQAGGTIAFTDGTNMSVLPISGTTVTGYPTAATDTALATGTYVNIFTPAPGTWSNSAIAPMGVVCGYYH